MPTHVPHIHILQAVLLLQTDITARAQMEMRMAALTESQLTMLENMFPRHVLEYIMGAAGPEATLGELAYQHDEVRIGLAWVLASLNWLLVLDDGSRAVTDCN